jgi:hypothetical protein
MIPVRRRQERLCLTVPAGWTRELTGVCSIGQFIHDANTIDRDAHGFWSRPNEITVPRQRFLLIRPTKLITSMDQD